MAKKTDRLTVEEKTLLKQAQNILETTNTPGWAAIAAYIQNSLVWPDPKEYKTREQLMLPYAEAYGATELAKKIGQFVSSQGNIVKSITDRMDSDQELPNFSIGT